MAYNSQYTLYPPQSSPQKKKGSVYRTGTGPQRNCLNARGDTAIDHGKISLPVARVEYYATSYKAALVLPSKYINIAQNLRSIIDVGIMHVTYTFEVPAGLHACNVGTTFAMCMHGLSDLRAPYTLRLYT